MLVVYIRICAVVVEVPIIFENAQFDGILENNDRKHEYIRAK